MAEFASHRGAELVGGLRETRTSIHPASIAAYPALGAAGQGGDCPADWAGGGGDAEENGRT